jgi:hypothetical protein
MPRKNRGRLKKMLDKDLSAIFLIFLMISTPFTHVYLFSNAIKQSKVSEQSFVKTVEVEGKKVDLKCFGKVTEYPNGTRLLEFSITIENVSKILPKIRMNCTKIIQLTEVQSLRTLSLSQQSLTTLGGYPGPLQTYPWDNIPFVKAPGNYSIYVKYDHDDTYNSHEEYPDLYPGEPNHPWEIPIGKHGNQKVHTHLSVDDMNAWIKGEMSNEEIMRKYSTLGGTVAGSFLGALLGAGLVELLSLTGGLGVVVTAIGAALGAFIGWLLEQLGITNKAQWIIDVVQAEQGDGFWWSWGFHTKCVDGIIFEPPIWDICSYEAAMRFFQHHRIGILFYEVKEFYKTSGFQRDASPEIWSSELWYEEWVNPGVFGLSADDFWYHW